MYTTIQVKEGTMNMLKSIKKEKKLHSYDDVLQELLKKKKKDIMSMHGYLKGDWDIMEDLRDKHDRF